MTIAWPCISCVLVQAKYVLLQCTVLRKCIELFSKYSSFSPGGRFTKAAGPSDPRREADFDPKQDCLTEPLLDWMAEAISEGAMELIREVTLEATLE